MDETEAPVGADNWDDLASWWVDVVRDDPAQSDDMIDVLVALLADTRGATLDLGCGEGSAMRAVGAGPVIGVDLSRELLRHASACGPVVQAELPSLSWVVPGSVDRAVSVGVLDLIHDHVEFFEQTAAAVRVGGHLVVVVNHPVVTAPGSEPLVDPDGEILWRWGDYLDDGTSRHHTGTRPVTLHHRPIGRLLTAASAANWDLEETIERGPGDDVIDLHPGEHGGDQIPSILGVRWRRRADQS